MAFRNVLLLLVAAATISYGSAQTTNLPILNITQGQPLPVLQEMQPDSDGWITLNMQPAGIQGPGDNTSDDTPYIQYYGRTYNQELIAGIVNVNQGSTFKLKVCNNLSSYEPTANGDLNSTYGKKTNPLDVGGISIFKDVNILANHLHGFFGPPGTDSKDCVTPLPAGSRCFVGDNIFEDMYPGECVYWEYDIPLIASPGALWIHPHHHGSSSLQTHTATVPVVINVNTNGGLDPLGSDSCTAMRRFFPIDNSNRIIMHFQTFMFAVFDDAAESVQNATGPIDDGYIANAVGSLPGDPFCCAGPEPEMDGDNNLTTWDNTGDTGPDAGNSSSLLPFYTSGVNALFATVNGAYQPVINIDAGKVYRIVMIEASTMLLMRMTFDRPGCVMGLYARDANYLQSMPRLADNLMLIAANRLEILLQCDAGTYNLGSGQNGLGPDPACGSSHCNVINQTILATFEVAAVAGAAPTPADPFGSCIPQRPVYQADLRDPALNATYRNEIIPLSGNVGLLNFTNPQVPGPGSSACALNGATYQDTNVLQEIIGELHELSLWNIDVHPYHHHTQPFQIIDFPGAVDSDANNGSWRIGDWADTLELPFIGPQAIVRWVPGPQEITGTGYAVLHCHILPHEDEGCMMRTQILAKEYAPEHKASGAHSQDGKAGLSIMVLVIVVVGVVAPVMKHKQKKRRRAAEAEALMGNQYGEGSGTSGSGASQTPAAAV